MPPPDGGPPATPPLAGDVPVMQTPQLPSPDHDAAGGSVRVTAPGVQLSLDGQDGGPLAGAIAFSTAQAQGGPSAACRPEQPGGAAPWVPEVRLSLEGLSAGPVAVAVALAVVERAVGPATCDRSVSLAVAVAAS